MIKHTQHGWGGGALMHLVQLSARTMLAQTHTMHTHTHTHTRVVSNRVTLARNQPPIALTCAHMQSCTNSKERHKTVLKVKAGKMQPETRSPLVSVSNNGSRRSRNKRGRR